MCYILPMTPNTERIYENLNGTEVREITKAMLEKLVLMVDGNPNLTPALAFPNVKIRIEAVIEPEAQPALRLSLSEGPFYAPDRAREIFGLGLPVVVKTAEGKKATTTTGKKATKGGASE